MKESRENSDLEDCLKVGIASGRIEVVGERCDSRLKCVIEMQRPFNLLRIRRIILYFSMTAWVHVFGKVKLLFCSLQSNKRFCAKTSKNSGKGIRNQTSTRRVRNWCLLKLLRLKRKKFNESNWNISLFLISEYC